MTSSRPALAVTGVTGVVGGHVARMLSDRGIELRTLARRPDRAPTLPGAVTVPCDYADHDGAVRALDGVTALFMVSAAESADRLQQHRAFIDAARDAGVRHVVYTSFVGAAPDAVFTLARDHFATEEHLKASGMGWTFLRDNFYLDFLPALVGEDGVIRGPAGSGRCAAVARIDVARTAAAVLQDPDSHAGRTYNLTGPEAMDFPEIAARIAAAQGRTVTFHDESLEEAYRSRLRWPAPQWQYDAWVSTYTAIAAGALARVSTDIETVTGTTPLGLDQVLGEA